MESKMIENTIYSEPNLYDILLGEDLNDKDINFYTELINDLDGYQAYAENRKRLIPYVW